MSVDIGFNYLEEENSQSLHEVKDREGLWVVIELKAQHLSEMGIRGAILKAPHKSHKQSRVVELVLIKKEESYGCLNDDDSDIN